MRESLATALMHLVSPHCLLATGTQKCFYESHDQGITWYRNYTYSMPNKAVGERFAITADGEDALWIVTSTGQVWAGRKY